MNTQLQHTFKQLKQDCQHIQSLSDYYRCLKDDDVPTPVREELLWWKSALQERDRQRRQEPTEHPILTALVWLGVLRRR